MAARIEVNGLGDLARESEIIDAVMTLDGLSEAKVEKGAPARRLRSARYD